MKKKLFLSFLSLNNSNRQKYLNTWSEFFREIHICYFFCGPHFYIEIKLQMAEPQDSLLTSIKQGNTARKGLDSLV